MRDLLNSLSLSIFAFIVFMTKQETCTRTFNGGDNGYYTDAFVSSKLKNLLLFVSTSLLCFTREHQKGHICSE